MVDTNRIIQLDHPEIEVYLRVQPRARRFTLRLDPSGSGAILTLPPGVPMTEARMFLLRQADWLADAVARRPDRVCVCDGCRLPVDGELVTIVAAAGPRRPPVLENGSLILHGRSPVAPRVKSWLKARARAHLAPAVHAYADALGHRVEAIAMKDTRSRWGSCSSAGRINLSWRLAMAPREIQEYVAAHEAAHLVEMNHSERFWSVLERLMPGYRQHKNWLRREGRELHRFQFGD
ncbi:MAG: SprT family zinc-dependent metalloprotease [Pseudomonadota bacterium]